MFSPIVFLKKVSRLDYTINSHENCCAGTIELILIVFHILKNYYLIITVFPQCVLNELKLLYVSMLAL